jgi:hypothetical protein
MTGNSIADDKLAAYRATQYCVDAGDEAFILKIDVVSGELRRLYEKTGQACCVFITAYNPFGQKQSDEANRFAQSQLLDSLRALRSPIFGGVGVDPDGAWPGEASVLALGVDENAARQLAERFKQDAVVWAGPDATPQLLVLR